MYILMDNYLCAYNMEGEKVKQFHARNFKPFGAVFIVDKLFLTDKIKKCVMIFDESFNKLAEFGSSYLSNPAGITVSASGEIYVLDKKETGASVVVNFQNDGRHIRQFSNLGLVDPWYIKRNQSDQIVISDSSKSEISVHSNNLSRQLYSFKTTMASRPNLHCRGMDIDDRGNVFVSLRESGSGSRYESIVKYDPRGRQPLIMEESPVSGKGGEPKCLDFVRGLHCCNHKGDRFLLVVDAGNKRVKVKPA